MNNGNYVKHTKMELYKYMCIILYAILYFWSRVCAIYVWSLIAMQTSGAVRMGAGSKNMHCAASFGLGPRPPDSL